MPPYRIEVLGPGDLHKLLALRSHQQTRPPGPATDQEVATWDRMMAVPGLSVYLATTADDEPIGTATSMMMPNLTYDGAPTLFIEAVNVLPPHRRRGVATSLLRACLDDARADGCDKVQLLSHKRHALDGAHALYTSLGFDAEAEGFRLYLRSG